MLKWLKQWFTPAGIPLRPGELADFLQKQKNAQLLDVRFAAEAKRDGEIPNSKRAEFGTASFAAQSSKLKKDQVTVVYCRSGHRSRMACRKLSAQGFTQIYDLQGGFLAWRQLGSRSK